MSPVCRSGGRWRVRQDRRSRGRENAFPIPYPRVRSCEERERREQSVWASVRVDGAKRLRRSRWERGTCKRFARGRDGRWPSRVGVHEDQIDHSWKRKRLREAADVPVLSQNTGTLVETQSRTARAGSLRDVDDGTGRNERAGPPSGGSVRSIRKNHVPSLPDSKERLRSYVNFLFIVFCILLLLIVTINSNRLKTNVFRFLI